MKQVFTFNASKVFDRCDNYRIKAVEELHRFDAAKSAMESTEMTEAQAFLVDVLGGCIGEFDYHEEELYLNEGVIEGVLLDAYFEAFKAELAKDLAFEMPDDFEFDAEFEVFDCVEDGWKVQPSSVEAPSGYAWIYKPSSFNPYEPSTYALVKKFGGRKVIPQDDYDIEVSDILDSCIEDMLTEMAGHIPEKYSKAEERNVVASGDTEALYEWFDIAKIRECVTEQLESVYLNVVGDGTSF